MAAESTSRPITPLAKTYLTVSDTSLATTRAVPPWTLSFYCCGQQKTTTRARAGEKDYWGQERGIAGCGRASASPPSQALDKRSSRRPGKPITKCGGTSLMTRHLSTPP
ncbi:unnamed protein product [Ectocarpus sp. 12 AP-2014]